MTFVKGHKLATGRPKGSKNRTTLLKEERRAIFEDKISQKWEEVIDQLRPEYVADQFLGKAPDTLVIETEQPLTEEEKKQIALLDEYARNNRGKTTEA